MPLIRRFCRQPAFIDTPFLLIAIEPLPLLIHIAINADIIDDYISHFFAASHMDIRHYADIFIDIAITIIAIFDYIISLILIFHYIAIIYWIIIFIALLWYATPFRERRQAMLGHWYALLHIYAAATPY